MQYDIEYFDKGKLKTTTIETSNAYKLFKHLMAKFVILENPFYPLDDKDIDRTIYKFAIKKSSEEDEIEQIKRIMAKSVPSVDVTVFKVKDQSGNIVYKR